MHHEVFLDDKLLCRGVFDSGFVVPVQRSVSRREITHTSLEVPSRVRVETAYTGGVESLPQVAGVDAKST